MTRLAPGSRDVPGGSDLLNESGFKTGRGVYRQSIPFERVGRGNKNLDLAPFRARWSAA